MKPTDNASTIRVIVAWAWPESSGEIAIDVDGTATADDALNAATARALLPQEVNTAAVDVGIWGRVKSRTTRLREADRIELYRALKADPKDARRSRVESRKK